MTSVKQAHRNRKTSHKTFEHCLLTKYLENYRIFRAKARRSIHQSIQQPWQSVNSRTSIKNVLDAGRQISGTHVKTLNIGLKM